MKSVSVGLLFISDRASFDAALGLNSKSLNPHCHTPPLDMCIPLFTLGHPLSMYGLEGKGVTEKLVT